MFLFNVIFWFLSFSVAHDEGISVPLDNSNTAFMPRFFYKDHLGNTRLVYSVAPNGAYITQENHYGPYGEVLEGIGSQGDWKFLYQGKEFVDGWGYDFHARNYDAWRGQFDGIDPVDHYGMGGTVAMYNNPVSVTDPDGRCPNCVTGLIGAAIGGLVNLGVKAYQGKIGGLGDGLAAFGIGAAAGFVTGFTGGIIAGAAGLSTTSILGGALAGSTGAIAGAPIQGLGNMAYFGDVYSGQQYATDILIGGVLGGISGGIANLIKGAKTGRPTNIWTDKPVLGGNNIWSWSNKPITRIDIEPVTFNSAELPDGSVTNEFAGMKGSENGQRVFTQTASDGDLMLYSTKIGDDIIEFGGDFSTSNGTLTIKNFDIDGGLTNKLGIRGVKDIITDFGRQQGVSQVIIEGAKRTTGANPGKIPSQLIFKIH